ncbi:phosphotransferase family protein [Micromonospora zingiberis]|uniref:phosphotransferase family protein n=1 Tax=Micromonospora zingiberis TaxID=2053011 RepID=UPI0013F4084E|nr:phosphotransferase [Micromonospora zingiberis]
MTDLDSPTAGANADSSYDSNDLVNIEAAVAEAVEKLQLTDLAPAGSGLEFVVHRAVSSEHGLVAVRVPRYRAYRFPGRKPFTAERSLGQEQLICGHLYAMGFPVAEPLAMVQTAAGPVLVSGFLPSDRDGAESVQIGELLARLHEAPLPPGLDPLDHDGYPVAEAVARRLRRRWSQMIEHLPALPPAPTLDAAIAALEPISGSPALLHLDIRACNLLSADDRITGWVDWTCAMVGHPGMELARLSEYAQLPENGLCEVEVRDGYQRVAPLPELDPALEALVRLDTVLMLGVIFFAYAPDATRQTWVGDRLGVLIEQCEGALGGRT